MEYKASDPLKRLPYESWARCMQLYARDQPEGPLPLLAVSSAWKEHLLEEPAVWATIYLDGGHDEECRTECFFHLSRSWLVELVLDKRPAAMNIAIKYRSRIKSLVFQTKSCSPSDSYTSLDISSLSQRLKPYRYPNVVHIYVEPPCDKVVLIPPGLVKACPALVGIHGAYVDQRTIPCLSPSTRELGLLGDGVLPRGIGDRLEILRARTLSTSQNVGFSEYFTAPSTRLRFFELKFPVGRGMALSRQRFSDSVHYHIPIQPFTSIPHYGLRVLSLTINWYDMRRLAPCLSACMTLRELALSLDFSVEMSVSEPWDVPPLTIADVGHIQKLSLSTGSLSSPWTGFSRHLSLVIDMFASGCAFQYLEVLRLTLAHYPVSSEIPDLLRTARSLKELQLIGFPLPVIDPRSDRILLENLHTLVAHDASNLDHFETPRLACFASQSFTLDFLDHLPKFSSTVESITSHSSFLYHWNELLVSQDTDIDPFPRLLKLRLISGWGSPDSTIYLNFSRLGSISFEEDFNRFGFTRRVEWHSVLNRFLLEILFSPEKCPCLHTIRSTMYPNWALVTAMFHRRNALKTVTPINSFWLPGYPQMSIFRILVRALGMADQHLGGDLHAAARMDLVLRYRWANVFFRHRACQLCTMSGYVACTSTPRQEEYFNAPDKPAITDLLDLDSPSIGTPTRLSAFDRAGWETHLRQSAISNDYIAGDGHREFCNRHNVENLVHIGAHVLDRTTYDIF